jgi:oligopeptide/dipeptide ABC transporter ATP-binding protein
MTETMSSAGPALSVSGLRISRGKAVDLVQEVSLTVGRGEKIGIVGESGSGKTTLCRAIAGNLPKGLAVSAGEIETAAEPGVRSGRGATMILQHPLAALHPMLRIGDQVVEAVRAGGWDGSGSARDEALAVLERTGLREAAAQMDRYPHQLSGGQRQRALVGMMLACRPRLLIADEPTSALDVTTQARLLDRLAVLVGEEGIALIVVTHDFGVAAKISDRLLVMYAGRVIEEGPTAIVLSAPRHPYTQALMRALPTLDGDVDRLEEIPGMPPNPGRFPQGCNFAPRCRFAQDKCRQADPPLATVHEDHRSACLRIGEIWPEKRT